eukprot:gb/GECH01012302.1/.p1 GENE.gb/GECH01012302.1/~~gb/GECH01012302.1/.p1  ORF type:complete len:502 (+),score=142.09 gb/GECH01012302.1/:1-1506(+)
MYTSSESKRLSILRNHLYPESKNDNQQEEIEENNFQVERESTSSGRRSITITDNRTGKQIEVPIEHDSVKATSLKQLGLRSFDPGYMNTAVARSAITYIDGENGILRYRGYNIEELAEKSNFMEVSYLLINGELPDSRQLDYWSNRIMKHSCLHSNMIQLLQTFRYDAHPMGMVISGVAALSTFYPDANPALAGQDVFKDERVRNKQIFRILGKLPTLAACAYRHRIGRPYNTPNSKLHYTENFLYMLDRLDADDHYRPHPVLVKALDILFMLHADHELNCSTAAMRHLSSSNADPLSSLAGAAGALYGPLHGGACEAVLRMLEEIGSVDRIPSFLEDVKKKRRRLMGFGHRVYKNYDPRARIVRKVADEVFEILGREPLIEIACELERQALEDEYFRNRNLYPNVDFYSGIIYKAMGFPTDMFPVLFAIPRTVGWMAHWLEFLDDKDRRIVRPRQLYLGSDERHYPNVNERVSSEPRPLESFVSAMSKRRECALVDEDDE